MVHWEKHLIHNATTKIFFKTTQEESNVRRKCYGAIMPTFAQFLWNQKQTTQRPSHTGIEPLSLSDFLDKTTGLFQSMDYVPTFYTGVEPLSLSSSSNKTNGLFQSMDHVPNDFPAITTSSFLQRYVLTTALQALSATTATTTVIKTPVSTTMTATMKAILIKLDNCQRMQQVPLLDSPVWMM